MNEVMKMNPRRHRPETFRKRMDKLVRRAMLLSASAGQPVTLEMTCQCATCGRVAPSRCQIDSVSKTFHLEPAPCNCATLAMH